MQDGVVNKDAFTNCFNARKASVERKYPGAFDFLKDGWDFMMLMIGLFLLYYYAVSPRIDALFGKDSKEEFDYGGWLKDMGKRGFNIPKNIGEKFTKNMGK
jgi:hypothetical protein